MLSYEKDQHIDAFLEVLDSQKYLREVLSEFSDLFYQISAGIGQVTSIDESLEDIQALQTKRIFAEIEFIEQEYKKFLENNLSGGDTQDTVGFENALRKFSDHYRDYLYSDAGFEKRRYLIRTLASAMALALSLDSVTQILKSVRFANQAKPFWGESKEGELAILFETYLDFHSFVKKLDTINVIYIELCRLANISITKHPLRIEKVESGSLWAEILGYPKIIAIFESVLEDSISYMYRTFTREGKITSIPKKVEAIESILELRKKLKAIGVETTELDNKLQKASLIIAEQTNILLAGEPRITLNGRVFSIGKHMEREYLEASKTLYRKRSIY